MSYNVKMKKQRALVLQGGVALGAYEAGAYKAFYKRLFKPGERLFDVIAGTSIGAINAAIIVSYVMQNRTWEGSADRLEEFWHYISQSTPANAKLLTTWWDETARRYYAVKDFFISGVDRVFSFPSIEYDFRFFDNLPIYQGLPNTSNNIWFHYNNNPLRESLGYVGHDGKKRFTKFPIATSYEGKDNQFIEPRLLTVCVDVQLGSTVTFDSYEYVGNECKICALEGNPPDRKDSEDLIKHLSEFHTDLQPSSVTSKRKDQGVPLRWSVYGDDKKKIVLYYNGGLELKHVMASGSFPVYFNYEDIQGRKYWDGGILSNTPLRELIHYHRDYWHKQKNMDVPDLDVFIVNIWPSQIDLIPYDHDRVKSRKNDLTFKDKTDYDQKVAAIVTDLIDLYKKTRDFAGNYIDSNKQVAFKADLDNYLSSINSKSKKRSSGSRDFKDLIDGRFSIEKLITVERKDDKHTISSKWADFTSDTIDCLIKEGESDATRVLDMERV